MMSAGRAGPQAHVHLERLEIVAGAARRLGPGEDRHVAGAVVVLVLHAPFPIVVPILLQHDASVKVIFDGGSR